MKLKLIEIEIKWNEINEMKLKMSSKVKIFPSGDEEARRVAVGVLLLVHRVRRPRAPPHHGRPSHGQRHQRVRQNQIPHRGNAEGLE